MASRTSPRFVAVAAVATLLSLWLLFRLLGASSSTKWLDPKVSATSARDAMYNGTLGFEKILVINLPSRSDHRDSMALASRLSNITVNYIDGVLGETVPEKILPPGGDKLSAANRGSWRAHMNAARTIVEQNLASALILEDDADWDIRLKHQLQDFGFASRALQHLPDTFGTDPINIDQARTANAQIRTPYGEDWDVLWLGHCGMSFPEEPADAPADGTPETRIAFYDDITVPESQFIRDRFTSEGIVRRFPSHTRVYHHPNAGVCSLAYALSQRGAQKLLYESAIHEITNNFDLILRELCLGDNGRMRGNCITVQPPLFKHHRPRGVRKSWSEISDHPDEFNDVAYTKSVRWSVRVNFAKLLQGQTDYTDQWPDGGTWYPDV